MIELSVPAIQSDETNRDCRCRACLIASGLRDVRIGNEGNIWWMVVCEKCGSKRCPHAGDHREQCCVFVREETTETLETMQ